MASIAQQDVIHNSDIDRGDDAITILVTIDYSTRVIIEQVVVKRCHVNAAHNAVAVNIAKHAADGSSSRHIAAGIIQDSTRKIPPAGSVILRLYTIFCYLSENSM